MDKVLTSASPEWRFQGPIRSAVALGTSGPTGAGIVRLQHRANTDQDWVNNQNVDLATGEHLAGVLVLTHKFNRVFVDGADGTTQVVVSIDSGQ